MDKYIEKYISDYKSLELVISGGQTGADTAGLLSAHKAGIKTGGTCPANYQTSAGPNLLLSAFNLKPKGTLKSRTIDNIRDSDGTIILTIDAKSPGSVLTVQQCQIMQKPYYQVDLNLVYKEEQKLEICSDFLYWFFENEIQVLNVAGNREKLPNCGVTYLAMSVLDEIFWVLNKEGFVLKQK